MIEVYYAAPADFHREKSVEECVSAFGGKLTYREEDPAKITLTIEFEKEDKSEDAIRSLRTAGVHIEGPCDY